MRSTKLTQVNFRVVALQYLLQPITGESRRPVLEALAGLTVLVVEDEPLVAMDIALALEDCAAQVLGPAHTVQQALHLLSAARPDAAVVDIDLEGEPALPVADALFDNKVPFILTTALDRLEVPERFASIANCAKPATSRAVLAMLAAIVAFKK